MTRSPLSSLLVVASIAAGLSACGSRERMSDNYGRSSREFFAKQHVYAKASTGSPSGLDSEESALIQGSYRKSLAGSGASEQGKDSPSRVLLLRDTPNGPNPNH